MSKVELTNLTTTELRKYVLEHSNDKEAFYNLVDRLQQQESSQSFPCPNNPENIKVMKQAIKEKLGK
ncbi:DUF6887 family protein [Geminocystis herdmanii]|uniref:DUF6887 family protein n=1 Tax=Geminocystis herdmanii TaxID=669359 RepID=UPI00034BA61C|nr:hypothetical protein [Geminocystis herdmanii]